MGKIRVGTSGYVYKHWRNLLYEGVPPSRWLERYAQVFDTVELNATFYRLPSASMVDGWRDRTPRGFLFACKGSRYLTHMKRLKDPGPGLDRYFEVVLRLGAKLGPILWLPPPAHTGGWRYVRFHGATGKYRGRYGRTALRKWARDLKAYGRDAYVYFNNDTHGHAVRDALDLSELLDQLPASAAQAAASVRA